MPTTVTTAFTSSPQAEKPLEDVRIAFAPLSLETVYRLADRPAHGAVVIMSGMVRNQTAGQAVVALEYQAYEPMALEVFRQIAQEIGQRWPGVGRVVIHHRIGKLQVGDISVLVGVGCPHRSEAFQACQFAIDNLKHRAPIWKKEWYQSKDGHLSGRWVSIGDCDSDG